MTDQFKDISVVQCRRVLSNIPDTCMIFFTKDLEVIEIIDQDLSLDELIPGHGKITTLKNIRDPEWSVTITELCQNALNGSEDTRLVQLESGQVKIKAFSINESGKREMGILVIKGTTGWQKNHNNIMKKEREEAEESSEIKSRFMARLSHEIRTPLNAIIGFIEQLEKTPLDKKQKNYLNIIDKSSVYLLDLVNETLTFSKIDAGELRLDEVDFKLEPLFRQIYRTFSIRAEEQKINLSLSFDKNLKIIVKGDAFRLRQIVNNLVSNAIKFTEYGYVELKVEQIKETDTEVMVRISISDTGIGIPKHKLVDIFREYRQASSGITRKHGGTGLGLTISQRLTKMMNGRILVSSTEGKGSLFTVEIPLKKSRLRELKKDTMEISTDRLAGRSVLIVDDDGMNRALGEIILEGFNMEVQVASDGREALEILQDNRFDVILLDIHMPVVSGIEVARQIRESEDQKGVKILAVTAEMIQEEIDRYLAMGIDDVLVKPYKEINLFVKLCKVLEVDSDEFDGEFREIILIEDETEPLYDLSELRSVTRKSESFFNEMIETFIRNATSGIGQIKEAHEMGDWKVIRETAHRLIPSYKHLEIKTVVSDLVELKNRSLNKPDRSKLSSLISRIDRETNKVVELLKKENASSE